MRSGELPRFPCGGSLDRERNATTLHCLGIDHKKLTAEFQGLDAKLTRVEEVSMVEAIWARTMGSLEIALDSCQFS